MKTSAGFECYTGDGPIMRRKSCPAMGEGFSDMCFKKEGGNLIQQDIKIMNEFLILIQLYHF